MVRTNIYLAFRRYQSVSALEFSMRVATDSVLVK